MPKSPFRVLPQGRNFSEVFHRETSLNRSSVSRVFIKRIPFRDPPYREDRPLRGREKTFRGLLYREDFSEVLHTEKAFTRFFIKRIPLSGLPYIKYLSEDFDIKKTFQGSEILRIPFRGHPERKPFRGLSSGKDLSKPSTEQRSLKMFSIGGRPVRGPPYRE